MKLPPQSKDAEMMVLGALLNSINALNIAYDSLYPSDFYYGEHKTIFEHVRTIRNQDKPVDIVILAEELKKNDKLKAVGDMAYLVTLSNFATTSAYIEEHCQIVKDKALLRAAIGIFQEGEKRALEEELTPTDIIDKAQKSLLDVSRDTNTDTLKTMTGLITGEDTDHKKPFMKKVEEQQELFQQFGEDAANSEGIKTHLYDLDKTLMGFNNSNLIILAARPAMGKTALALNIATNIAIVGKLPTAIFSLEMTAEEMGKRIICAHAEVSLEKVKVGSISSMEYHKLNAAAKEIEGHQVFIDDVKGVKISQLKSKARRLKDKQNIGFLVIDYLQLILGSGSRQSEENRQIQVAEISRELKLLAGELNIPILCLSQLSRKSESRTDLRPLLSDLRESGSIEQDADVVMMIHRPDYYDPNKTPGLAEVNILKNRHGKVGQVLLTYKGEYTKFTNYTPVKNPFKTEGSDGFGDFE